MARPGASEDVRIRKLYGSLERAKTAGLVGQVLTQAPMCELLGVKPATLRPWLDDEEVENSGAFIRGGRGADYSFDPIATIWVLIRFFERQRDAKASQNMRLRRMVAGDRLDDAPDDMTVRDVREAMQLHLQILEADKEAGRLIDAEASARRYSELVLAMREACLSAPQKLDPTNQWEPEFREKFDNALADFMVLLRQAGEGLIGDETVPRRADAAGKRAASRRPAG